MSNRQLLLSFAILFVFLATPVAAQEAATSEPSESAGQVVAAEPTASSLPVARVTPKPSAAPTYPPLPTPVPYSEGALVQAVLFFLPTCGHCHQVITETLPPLFAENGGEPVVSFDQSLDPQDVAFYLMSNGQLQLLLVDASVADGQAMFRADSTRLAIDSAGVPRLDMEDAYLVGSGEIPADFPDIVKEGLAGDGLAWPPVPGLARALGYFVEQGAIPDPNASTEQVGPAGTAEPEATPEAGASTEPAAIEAPAASADAAATAGPDEDDALAVIPLAGGDDGSWLDKFGNDPTGNSIAVLVLLLLGVSIIAAPLLAVRGALPTFPSWLVIVLAAVGIAVAAYLATVETNGGEAVCGPVGDCNAVQQSQYSRLLGVHIGVLGIVGYGLIGLLWLVSRVAKGALADWSLVLIAGGTMLGVAFSAYLTFLEPFVIGATCMWCITSALVMLALLWVSVGPGWDAWQRVHGSSDGDAHATAGA